MNHDVFNAVHAHARAYADMAKNLGADHVAVTWERECAVDYLKELARLRGQWSLRHLITAKYDRLCDTYMETV